MTALFDRERLKINRNRAAAGFADHGFLFDWAHDILLDRLADVTRDFPAAVQIGGRGARFESKKIGALTRMDLLDPRCLSKATPCRGDDTSFYVVGDEEFFPFAGESLDLLISNLSLHSVNDLPGALVQMRRALKPDGLFLASMLGGETLRELRESLIQAEMSLRGGASARVLPFADKPQMGDLLQRAGFALPVVDSEIVRVSYDNAFKLMRDIRGMGEGNMIAARDRRYPGREFFAEAARHYQAHFADSDGRIEASFEVIFLIGWAPHESQQNPLRPGSAEVRLADALDADEVKI